MSIINQPYVEKTTKKKPIKQKVKKILELTRVNSPNTLLSNETQITL
jgi:hypothetical protein